MNVFLIFCGAAIGGYLGAWSFSKWKWKALAVWGMALFAYLVFVFLMKHIGFVQ